MVKAVLYTGLMSALLLCGKLIIPGGLCLQGTQQNWQVHLKAIKSVQVCCFSQMHSRQSFLETLFASYEKRRLGRQILPYRKAKVSLMRDKCKRIGSNLSWTTCFTVDGIRLLWELSFCGWCISHRLRGRSKCWKVNTWPFWAHLCTLHVGLICIAFCLSVCD